MHTTALSAHFDVLPARTEPGRRIPFVGVIGVGQPFPTFQVFETLRTRSGAWPRRQVLALRVRGSSLIDDGILDGDFLLVEGRDQIRDGQTVVAEVNGRVTVKRFYAEPDGGVRLQPANSRVLPLVLRSDRVHVRGVVVGILRKHGFARNANRRGHSVHRATSTTRARLADRRTLDLGLKIVEHNLAEWNRLIAADPRRSFVQASGEIKSLGQSLRALKATYTATENLRLRKALLHEAGRVSGQMRAVAARLRWGSVDIRPFRL